MPAACGKAWGRRQERCPAAPRRLRVVAPAAPPSALPHPWVRARKPAGLPAWAPEQLPGCVPVRLLERVSARLPCLPPASARARPPRARAPHLQPPSPSCLCRPCRSFRSPLPVSAMGPTGAAWAAGWKEECQPSAIIPSGCPRATPQRRGAADGGYGVLLPARHAVTGRSLRGDRAGRWEGHALRSSPSARARRRCARAACCRRTRRSS